MNGHFCAAHMISVCLAPTLRWSETLLLWIWARSGDSTDPHTSEESPRIMARRRGRQLAASISSTAVIVDTRLSGSIKKTPRSVSIARPVNEPV